MEKRIYTPVASSVRDLALGCARQMLDKGITHPSDILFPFKKQTDACLALYDRLSCMVVSDECLSIQTWSSRVTPEQAAKTLVLASYGEKVPGHLASRPIDDISLHELELAPTVQ